MVWAPPVGASVGWLGAAMGSPGLPFRLPRSGATGVPAGEPSMAGEAASPGDRAGVNPG